MLKIQAVIFLLLPAFALAAAFSTDNNRTIYATSGVFSDVRDDIVDAILEKGMVISNVSFVGDMLARTGEDLGESVPIYGKAEVLEFCNAVLSRRALETDPHTIVYCPYRIAIYSLPDAPQRIYVAYPRLRASVAGESGNALQAVEDMLHTIVENAIE